MGKLNIVSVPQASEAELLAKQNEIVAEHGRFQIDSEPMPMKRSRLADLDLPELRAMLHGQRIKNIPDSKQANKLVKVLKNIHGSDSVIRSCKMESEANTYSVWRLKK